MFLNSSCNSFKTEVDSAFIGGEIINPNSKFVILEKDNKTVDSIKLDGKNRFKFKIDSLIKGVYTFKHGDEYQMILVEPFDSILLRMNTLEFDESLVYSGKGSKKNNYFINEFLENEKSEKHILKLCQLNPQGYIKHIDSLKDKKLKLLENFNKKHKNSDLFKKIALANINYSYYSSMEVYPFIHYGNKNKGDLLNTLPEDFYSYRKDINYNDTFFKHYHNYKTLLRHNFNTLALEMHTHHAKDKKFRWGSLCYNLDRLKLIDSLVDDESIKNDLLYYFTIKHLSLNRNVKNNSALLKSFLSKSSDEEAKIVITDFANSLINLEPGSTLPNIKIIDFDNNEFEIASLIKTPTVISYWSQVHFAHFKKSHNKIKELKTKFPEVSFVTINIDKVGIDRPKQTLKKSNFSYTNQFVLKDPNKSKKELAIYPMTKAMIIDKKGEIVNSNTNMFSINFEKQLLELLNN
ncbi:hypothetical protein N1F78_13140 [Seonamhaeicola sp. MEBiC1930]|uniref:TlpA family protein disulfide reductase n=1 Tax=Seonamhaeicola sp. MEBiC01930 TaxID=2976768 RepID=UPI00325057B4